jgi:glyoxylase-like metal-dependent hydrolase (beta-lactamase superfamily II)
MDGMTAGFGSARLVCHCLLVETNQGLVLIDTGFGLADVRRPRKRLSAFFRAVSRPRPRETDTAVRQIERLGFRAEEVRHIVLTHLDFDHAGGVTDFPHATVHLYQPEYHNALHPEGFLSRNRFRPAQWPRHETWQKYIVSGEAWFGFECVRELAGLPPEILLVPLVGHTRGHCGVAVQTKKRWLLLAGDAYFYHGEKQLRPVCPPGARLYQKMVEADRAARLNNQERIRELVSRHGREIDVFCSHDLTEFAAHHSIVHEGHEHAA